VTGRKAQLPSGTESFLKDRLQGLRRKKEKRGKDGGRKNCRRKIVAFGKVGNL
jgi:hypothetical protein